MREIGSRVIPFLIIYFFSNFVQSQHIDDLSNNYCLNSPHFDFSATHESFLVSENTQIVSNLIELSDLRSKLKVDFLEKVGNLTCTTFDNSVKYFQPINLEETEELTALNKTLLLNGFYLIDSNTTSHCLLENIRYDETSCKAVLQSIASLIGKREPSYPSFRGSNTNFDPLNVSPGSKMATFVLLLTPFGFAFTQGYDGSICSHSLGFDEANSIKADISDMILDLNYNLIDFIRPLLHGHYEGKQAVTTSDFESAKQFNDIKQHFSNLYFAISKDQSRLFPIVTFNEGSKDLPKSLLLYIRIMTDYERFSLGRSKRSNFWTYLLAGDQIDTIAANQETLKKNTKISNSNFHRISQQQHSLFSAQKSLALNELDLSEKLRKLKIFSQQLSGEISLIQTLLSKCILNLENNESLLGLQLQIYLLKKHFEDYFLTILSSTNGCAKPDSMHGLTLCHIHNQHVTFEKNDFFLHFVGRKMALQLLYSFECLETKNGVFNAHGKRYIFQNDLYINPIDLSSFHKSCLSDISICTNDYSPAKRNLFNSCNIINDEAKIFVSCQTDIQINLAGNRNITIDKITRLEPNDFPISRGNESFSLKQIFTSGQIPHLHDSPNHKFLNLQIIDQDGGKEPNINIVTEASPIDDLLDGNWKTAHYFSASALTIVVLVSICTITICCRSESCRNNTIKTCSACCSICRRSGVEYEPPGSSNQADSPGRGRQPRQPRKLKQSAHQDSSSVEAQEAGSELEVFNKAFNELQGNLSQETGNTK